MKKRGVEPGSGRERMFEVEKLNQIFHFCVTI